MSVQKYSHRPIHNVVELHASEEDIARILLDWNVDGITLEFGIGDKLNCTNGVTVRRLDDFRYLLKGHELTKDVMPNDLTETLAKILGMSAYNEIHIKDGETGEVINRLSKTRIGEI